MRTLLLAIVFAAAAQVPAAYPAEDPFAANVRPTEPLTPEQQRGALKVPEGFTVQLVAAEPDIHKPMNLAFDSAGRLWVTTSREYPRPAPPDREARDRLMVFEDFGPDGRARKVTEFASGLNIPIGVHPFRAPGPDGRLIWKAAVWSIPHIWILEDRDGDGRSDHRERLFGPFDHTRDTHGNQASFRRGWDGWVYATHGFNNDSHVQGRDGHRVDLNSGNTYRFRLDGSRIEHHTWGQVNPFGLAWDPDGNLYSSDCHSEPIYLLLAGGYYPSFGKPHDGLGFAPSTMEQIRGSTAIDGISYCADALWPAEYQDSVFIGDVMTSRVYRDRAEARGSGRVARPRPDFVVSADPWFRPVDTTFGPDGALYIADFYNRIIGHYEVPLDHPGRDRERGRIWRVVPAGVPLRPPALAKGVDGWVGELGSGSLVRRMLAVQELADAGVEAAVPALRRVIEGSGPAEPRTHALWLLETAGHLREAELLRAMGDSVARVRAHALRMAAERARIRGTVVVEATPGRAWTAAIAARVIEALRDADPLVRRCAAEALGQVPDEAHVAPLLELGRAVPSEDTHLRYTVRQALRNQLRDDAVFASVRRRPWPESDHAQLVDVSQAVNSPEAAGLLLDRMALGVMDPALARSALAHAARHASAGDLPRLVKTAQALATEDPDFELALLESVKQGLDRRGGSPGEDVRAWAVDLAGRLLDSVARSRAWVNVPGDGPGSVSPWEYQERSAADGATTRLLSSHPRGESLVGTLRSPVFATPDRIAFHLAGHDGPPSETAGGRNRVELRDARTGELLRRAPAPRTDVAQRVEWSLEPGREVRLEVVDADTGNAWAWIALGRIEGEAPALPELAPATVVNRQVAAVVLAGWVEAAELAPALDALVRDASADPAARAAALRVMRPDPVRRAIASVAANVALPFGWRARLLDATGDGGPSAVEPFLAAVWKDAPLAFQVAVAGIAGARQDLARALVTRMTEGQAPAGLLQDPRLREALRRAVGTEMEGAFDALVRSLPEEDAGILQVLRERVAAYRAQPADAARGKAVFVAACAACHQIGGEGGLVGPQLTGIGTRGVERLCEDILMPHRNVDHAFWTTVLSLRDGEEATGLFRREEGELLILANAAGAEFSVPKSEVIARRESRVSLMPANFGEAIGPDDFRHLLAYLMAQDGRAP